MDIINSELFNIAPSSWSESINKTETDEQILKGPPSLKAINDYSGWPQDKIFKILWLSPEFSLHKFWFSL